MTKTNYVSTENMLQNFLGLEPYLDESMIEGILFRKSDTLLANIRPYLRKTWFATENGACSTDVLAIHPTNVDPKFLYNVIAQNSFIDYVMSGAKGSKMPRGDKAHIMEYEIAIPNNVYEQNKIADFLQLISDRIEKIQQLIEHLKKYKRGVVKAIFSGKLNLSAEYPFEFWENKAICECLKYEQPQKYIVATEKYDDSFTTPVLTANKGFILGYTDEQQGIYDKGDVIIYDDFTMDMKYVTFNFKVKSSTIKMLTPTQGNDLYFMYSLLQSLELQPEGHQRSYISKVEPMIVQVPPYELQLHISEFLKNIDDRVVFAEKQLALLVTQKQGLMQGLFA